MYACGPDFGPRQASKIDPKRLQNQIKNECSNICSSHADFGLNLAPTLRQVGPQECFLTGLGSVFDPSWGPRWEVFPHFFAFKLQSYLEVVLASILYRFWTPLEPRKLRSCRGETHIFEFLKVLYDVR